MLTTVIARPSRSGGASWATAANDIDQNPAIATPSSSREATSSGNDGVSATMTFETSARPESAASSNRRSRVGTNAASVGAAKMPMIAVAVTAWPASPSLMPRSAAMRDSTLAGRNSAVTTTNPPSPSAATAYQTERVRTSTCWQGYSVATGSGAMQSAEVTDRPTRARAEVVPGQRGTRTRSRPWMHSMCSSRPGPTESPSSWRGVSAAARIDTVRPVIRLIVSSVCGRLASTR